MGFLGVYVVIAVAAVLSISIVSVVPAYATCGDPFVGEICMFGGNFAIRSFSFCHGQLLPISSNTALFSIYGTTYGGDGRTTFALPDLRGRTPIGAGNPGGPGLTPRTLGERGGAETVTLVVNQTPHNHIVNAVDQFGNSISPNGNLLPKIYARAYNSGAATTTMDPGMIANAGGGQAHNNMQPYLAINYLCSLTGTFPSRS